VFSGGVREFVRGFACLEKSEAALSQQIKDLGFL
jgi:hypothetical protein